MLLHYWDKQYGPEFACAFGVDVYLHSWTPKDMRQEWGAVEARLYLGRHRLYLRWQLGTKSKHIKPMAYR